MTDTLAALLLNPTLSPLEVRTILRVGHNSIYNALAANEIPHFRIGGKIKIRTSWLKKQLGISEAA
jgi:hypothetical protein